MVLNDPSPQAFDALFESHDLVAVDFYATWCGPCKSYSPKFTRVAREIARSHPDARIAFVKVDVDRHHALASAHSVRSVPTTVVLAQKKGFLGRVKRVERLRFSGDKPMNELVRDFTALVTSRSAP